MILRVLLTITFLLSVCSLHAEENVFIKDVADRRQAISAVKAALIGRKWKIIEQDSSHIVGEMNRRDIEARLYVKFVEGDLIYNCECFKTRKKKMLTGKKTKRRSEYLPKGWVGNLIHDSQSIIAQANSEDRAVSDISGRLLKLKELYEAELITKEEYDKKKQAILDEI